MTLSRLVRALYDAIPDRMVLNAFAIVSVSLSERSLVVGSGWVGRHRSCRKPGHEPSR